MSLLLLTEKNPAYAPLSVLPPWINSILFVGIILTLLFAEWALFRSLKNWSQRHQSDWYNSAIKPLKYPCTLFILSIAVGSIPLFFKIPFTFSKIATPLSRLLIILGLCVFAQKVLMKFYEKFLFRHKIFKTYAQMGSLAIKVTVYGILLLVFLDMVGISVTPLIASLGIGSIAVAFALKETLSNLFSGLYLIVDQPIRVGDYIRIESGEEGYVETIGWRSTHIRMLQNNVVIVPNERLTSKIITNYDLLDHELAVLVSLGVAYESDLEKVEKITVEVAREIMQTTPGGVPSFEPFIRYDTFGDFSIRFTVILRGKEFVDQYLIKHEFVKKLHRRYHKEGIVIPTLLNPLYLSGSPLQIPSSSETTRSLKKQ